MVELRPVQESDLDAFFNHQLDPEANHMAAFVAKDPADQDGFYNRWQRVLADEAIVKRTIVVDGRIAGHIVRFEQFGKPGVGYWLGRDFWGRGVATAALTRFLQELPERPLFARVAWDNTGSLRVLQKCGFVEVERDSGYAYGRGGMIEEIILELQAPAPIPPKEM